MSTSEASAEATRATRRGNFLEPSVGTKIGASQNTHKNTMTQFDTTRAGLDVTLRVNTVFGDGGGALGANADHLGYLCIPGGKSRPPTPIFYYVKDTNYSDKVDILLWMSFIGVLNVSVF